MYVYTIANNNIPSSQPASGEACKVVCVQQVVRGKEHCNRRMDGRTDGQTATYYTSTATTATTRYVCPEMVDRKERREEEALIRHPT